MQKKPGIETFLAFFLQKLKLTRLVAQEAGMNHTSLALESLTSSLLDSEELNRQIVSAVNSELRMDLPETKGMMAVGFGSTIGLSEARVDPPVQDTVESVAVCAKPMLPALSTTVSFDSKEIIVKSAAVFLAIFMLMLLGFQGAILLQEDASREVTEVAAR